jgi:hypothetical protein
VAEHFIVRQVHGPEWNDGVGRREQAAWDEHAAFVDTLVDDGFVVLGGPVGEDVDGDVVLVVEAEDEAALRERFAPDPWLGTILQIESVEHWSVWLRRER